MKWQAAASIFPSLRVGNLVLYGPIASERKSSESNQHLFVGMRVVTPDVIQAAFWRFPLEISRRLRQNNFFAYFSSTRNRFTLLWNITVDDTVRNLIDNMYRFDIKHAVVE